MFQIDVMSRTPIYEQLINQLEFFVLNGILTNGDKIPSVRSLSTSLSVNPNTIQKAYLELDRRGIIQSVPGKGCFITPAAKDILNSKKREQLKDLQKIVRDLLLADISKEEILDSVKEALEEGTSLTHEMGEQ